MRFLLPILSFSFAAVFICIPFTGCTKRGTTQKASFGSSEQMLSFGVYSAQAQDSSGMATKLSLNQNYTYSRKKFQGDCLMAEYKGDWKSDQLSVEFHLTEVRKRTDCNTEDWQVEKVDTPISRMLRNVTTTSFDLLDQEEDVSAQWTRYLKR